MSEARRFEVRGARMQVLEIGQWWRIVYSTGRAGVWHRVARVDEHGVLRCRCYHWPRLPRSGSIQVSDRLPPEGQVSAMRCLVVGCRVDATGKMVVCSPHWQYLSAELRETIIEVHNELARQRSVGNPRRATRDAWRALLPRVTAELDAAHAQLEAALGERVPADGVAWRRASRRIDERIAGEPEAEQA